MPSGPTAASATANQSLKGSDPGSEESDPGSEESDPGSEESDPGSEESGHGTENSDSGSEGNTDGPATCRTRVIAETAKKSRDFCAGVSGLPPRMSMTISVSASVKSGVGRASAPKKNVSI